jgi:hypothetical protein
VAETGVYNPQVVAYGDGVYLAVGYYRTSLYISTDGKVWNQIDVPSGSGDYYDVIYVEGVGFVVTGYDGGVFLYNRDGTWSDMSISGGYYINGVTHADGMYVAVNSDGKIYTRRDGDAFWSQQYSGAYSLYSVAYADGRFTAVGGNGMILTSDDGANWTQVPALWVSDNYHAVAGGGGIIVAVGWSGQITTCDANGVWTTQTPEGENYFHDVIYVEGVGFAAVGISIGYDDNINGVIYISQDGINWIPQSVPDGVSYLNGITYDYDNGKFMAVGYEGDVIEGTPE